MKAIVKASETAHKMEAVLLQGDLAKLSPDEKVSYYNRVCESLGLNPLTKPFDYFKLNGREVLYAKRDATDQLRKIHGVSIVEVKRETADDLVMVTAKAKDKSGREDTAMGALSIKGLSGEGLANALMKAETKAKRRVTLSICGLGLLDETEIEDAANSERDVKAEQIQAKLEGEIEAPQFESADFYQPLPLEAPQPGDYVLKVGRSKGKRLSDVKNKDLENLVIWIETQIDQGKHFHSDVLEDLKEVRAYLSTVQESE